MKIYLFLNDKILSFLFSKNSSESFSFDEDPNEESKLINIEVSNEIWYIYSTVNVKLFSDNTQADRLPLKSGNFYTLTRDNINYLIYVTDVANCTVNMFSYGKNLNLTIGKSNNSSIVINTSVIGDVCARIQSTDSGLTLEKADGFVYLNDFMIAPGKHQIKMGDQISIYYVKLIFLVNFVIVIGDTNVNLSNALNTSLKQIKINQEQPVDISVSNDDLYSKNDYYFKSPRLRRFIETKKIKLSKPPSLGADEELPAILTIGPIFTMAIVTFVSLTQSLSSIFKEGNKISSQLPSIISAVAMIVSMLLWPLVTKRYNKKLKEKKKRKAIEKYQKYLGERREELAREVKYQSDVLYENLLSTSECINVISKKEYNFWDRRNDQDDFLQVRLGLGVQKLKVDINYSDEDFTVEEDALKKEIDKVIQEYKNINNVPVSYSFYENKITAIIGNIYKSHVFINNLILQLLTYYTYEDLKFVVFTNEKKKSNWEYLKYTNHNFSNLKDIRFFSTEINGAKSVSKYLHNVANQRIEAKSNSKNEKTPYLPHYIILIDDYNMVKSLDFIRLITESEDSLGFSVVLLEDRLSEMPSKCNNFILVSQNKKCEIIKNGSNNQEHLEFDEEILYNIDMMKIAREVANKPIEFQTEAKKLPESISFLEMEKVGKVEQLNILNRWNTNDSTISLKSEIGVDEYGNLINLDLHEKEHGPHGLIAGTTGSGKSELIITYVLSMCVNYGPDIVSFALIDYKGGGLALAFENRSTGVVLPHLAGTITNLDKAEMNRTLVSIESEINRRQIIFNQARELLGESTIDIYKYQKYYKEGKLKEPVTHLFIICDEFAELKSQQPEFMDDLISVARIGRSLGVHLILATQKPSGVVNDQIWSNSRFKICLKVQDESDSKEMLKRTDAAYLKQVGRFYLQVGYDEYYVLGQSGWCGAKYYPSDIIIKDVDNNINFIDDQGNFIKDIKTTSNIKIEPKGDQFSSILSAVINASNKMGKVAKKLWLDNIKPKILVDDLKTKYNVVSEPYKVEAILGEYDAPEIQTQGIVKHNFLDEGNTIIYGNDGSENEMLLDAMLYSTCKYHSSEEINFYIIDYGSESLKKYATLPHVGGVVYSSDEERYNSLIKFIGNEIIKRKKLFSNYGGEYKNYVKKNKIPLIVVIMNNFDSIYEANSDLFEVFPELLRDSERYGIIFILTCNTVNSVGSKISSNCPTAYAFKLKDTSDYYYVFGSKANIFMSDILGRGFLKHDTVHEFQTASIVIDEDNYMDYINTFVRSQQALNQKKSKQIPILPDKIRYDDIKNEVSSVSSIPIGISKLDLSVINIDFLSGSGNIISSNKLSNTNGFIKSLVYLFESISSLEVFVIDAAKSLNMNKNYLKNYFDDDINNVTLKLINYINNLIEKKANNNCLILIYGLSSFLSKLEDKKTIEKLLTAIKEYEEINVIIVEEVSKLKDYTYESWFRSGFSLDSGLWIGKGLYNQSFFNVFQLGKDTSADISNDMGYLISDNQCILCKLLDFFSKDEE